MHYNYNVFDLPESLFHHILLYLHGFLHSLLSYFSKCYSALRGTIKMAALVEISIPKVWNYRKYIQTFCWSVCSRFGLLRPFVLVMVLELVKFSEPIHLFATWDFSNQLNFWSQKLSKPIVLMEIDLASLPISLREN